MVRKALAVIAVLSLVSCPLSAGEQGPGAPLQLKKAGHNLDSAQTAVDIDGANVAFDGVGAYKPSLVVAGESGPPGSQNKPAAAPAKAEGDDKGGDKGGGNPLGNPAVGAAIGAVISNIIKSREQGKGK